MPCQMGPENRLQKLRDAASESDESNKIQKTKHRCIVEAHESTRNRLESTLPKDHEDHIAEKRFKSISHYNLVHKFIPTPRRCENSRCESRSGQGKEEAPNIASLAIRQGEEQKGGYSVSTMREKENPLCYIDGHLSSQECGVGTEVPEVYRGRVVLRGDIVKDDSGVDAVFTEQESSQTSLLNTGNEDGLQRNLSATPRGGMLFGRLVEQSPLTWYATMERHVPGL